MKRHLKNYLKKHKPFIIAMAVIVAVLVSVLSMYVFSNVRNVAGPKHLVTFYDRGARQSIVTRAQTVRAALSAGDMKLDAQDVVEPSMDTKLESTNVDIIVYRSRPVSIIDDGRKGIVLTVAQSPNEILKAAKFPSLAAKDKAEFGQGNIVRDGATMLLTIDRAEKAKVKEQPKKVVFKPGPNALTAAKGAQVFVDSDGVAHRETYYDLPMNIVIGACGKGDYTIRSDGAKIDKDGYVLVAANFSAYPRCSVVETSMGPGKVYDTGGFIQRHPYGFDLATDWTNRNGR